MVFLHRNKTLRQRAIVKALKAISKELLGVVLGNT